MMTQNSSDYSKYRLREDGVHEFTFTGDERHAVDMFIDQLHDVYADASKDNHIHLLLDARELDAGPPVRYLARKIQPFFDKFPNRPTGSMAILTERGSFLTILNNFLKLFSRNNDRFRFFRGDEKDKAIDWLLQAD